MEDSRSKRSQAIVNKNDGYGGPPNDGYRGGGPGPNMNVPPGNMPAR